MVDHTNRRYTFQAFTSFLLTHYRCPERHTHKEMKEIVLLSAILILPVTLAPPTGFHASKKRERPARHQSRSQSFVPLDQRSENESSGSIHLQITMEITEFCISGFTARACAVRSRHIWYLWRMPEMDDPRALVFRMNE